MDPTDNYEQLISENELAIANALLAPQAYAVSTKHLVVPCRHCPDANGQNADPAARIRFDLLFAVAN